MAGAFVASAASLVGGKGATRSSTVCRAAQFRPW